jgi:hypothetical protein
MKIPVAIILDNNQLEQWQIEALDFVENKLDIKLILNCNNTSNKKNFLKNFFYYFINLFCLKNFYTKKVDFQTLPDIQVMNFNSIYNGSWQRIPDEVLDSISKKEIKVILKFGMSLLTITNDMEHFDILSFHHGDPEKYRGRPAGFYEILNNAERIGTIVQKLSNKLDAGSVYAKGYSKIFHHSYKLTALNFFKNSKYILNQALINYSLDITLPQNGYGKNYKLPSNLQALTFFCKLMFRKFKRVLYGTFFEKSWNIGVFQDFELKLPSISLLKSQASIPKIYKSFSFYADPFYSSDGSLIRVEALNKLTGLGEIIELDSRTLELKAKCLSGDHYSYPFSFAEDQNEYLMPEVASHSSQAIYLSKIDKYKKIFIKGIEKQRVVDSTLFKHNEVYFLFCSPEESSFDNLSLFYSDTLFGEYLPHPLNPIVLDPSSARMGGRIKLLNGQILRFGQNNSYDYGKSLSISKISIIDKANYQEEVIGAIDFRDTFGPHTIDILDNKYVVDFYTQQFSLLAGYRRMIVPIREMFKKRS